MNDVKMFKFVHREDFEYTRETFPWRRHTRDLSQSDSFNRRTMSLGRNHMMYGTVCDSRHFSDHQYNAKCNDDEKWGNANKVIPKLKYCCKLLLYLLTIVAIVLSDSPFKFPVVCFRTFTLLFFKLTVSES